MAVAGLVLGIAACFFTLAPFISLGVLFSIYIGMLCSIVGIIFNAIAKKRGAGDKATAGLVLSIVAMSGTLLSLVAAFSAFGRFW